MLDVIQHVKMWRAGHQSVCTHQLTHVEEDKQELFFRQAVLVLRLVQHVVEWSPLAVLHDENNALCLQLGNKANI